jgi:hypothetical protein
MECAHGVPYQVACIGAKLGKDPITDLFDAALEYFRGQIEAKCRP